MELRTTSHRLVRYEDVSVPRWVIADVERDLPLLFVEFWGDDWYIKAHPEFDYFEVRLRDLPYGFRILLERLLTEYDLNFQNLDSLEAFWRDWMKHSEGEQG